MSETDHSGYHLLQFLAYDISHKIFYRTLMVSGYEYKLEFMYDGVVVSSTTEVPSKPSNITFSATSIEVMGGGILPMPMSKASQDGIEISWDNEEGEYYIIEGKTDSTTTLYDFSYPHPL